MKPKPVSRKQVVKFFFDKNMSPAHQRKVFMALIVSDVTLLHVGGFECEKWLDNVIGDHEHIQRIGVRKWMQRNAFMFRGYLCYLDEALKRLEFPIQHQALELPNYEKLVRAYIPIGQDNICLYVNEARDPKRRLAWPLRMHFKTFSEELMKKLNLLSFQQYLLGKVKDFCIINHQNQFFIQAKTNLETAKYFRDEMRKSGHEIGFQVLPQRSFQDLLLTHALFCK